MENRYLDTFRPKRIQAGTGFGNSAGLFIPPDSDQDRPGTRKERDHLRHWTYWTYVAVKRIADMFSEPFPQLSILTRNKTPSSKQHLSQNDRTWIKQHYGGRWLQSNRDDFEPLPDNHPLTELLERVNDQDCWQEFAFETCLMWQLTGRFYWFMPPNGFGLPAEITVIPTPWVFPRYAKNGKLIAWKIQPDGGNRPEEFPPEWVLEGKFKSPVSKLGAWSPLHAGPLWVDSVEAIEQSRYRTFKQGINPSVMLLFEAEKYRDPKEDILTRIEQKFLSRLGGTENDGKPLMVPPGVKAVPWARTPKEMDFTGSSEQARDNNLVLFGVPKTVAGITDDVNRATFEGSLLAFCRVTMNPLFRLFAGVLTEKLSVRFDSRIRVWFPDCTPASADHELDETRLDWEMGAIGPDERRMERGRKPRGTSLYETGYIGSGRVPLNEDLQPEPEPDPSDGKPPGSEDDDASSDD